MPIHITGNPRGDMLRSEIRPYFAPEVEKLRSLYGDFILINTNFSDVNPYIPSVGLFLPTKAPSQPARLGQSGIGMSRQFAEGLRAHKLSVLEDFKQLIPMLEQAFPELTIIVRPHPSESYQIYHQIAAKCPRVVITNQGNVMPGYSLQKRWYTMAARPGWRLMFLMFLPISYLATLNKYYDYDFQGLPTKLSYQCFNFEELAEICLRFLRVK